MTIPEIIRLLYSHQTTSPKVVVSAAVTPFLSAANHSISQTKPLDLCTWGSLNGQTDIVLRSWVKDCGGTAQGAQRGALLSVGSAEQGQRTAGNQQHLQRMGTTPQSTRVGSQP